MFFSFFPLAYLAEAGPELAGFKTDSLGRMTDSEASNEGFYVHKFIKRYQFHSLSLPSRYLLLLAIIITAALLSHSFCSNDVLQLSLAIMINHLNRLLSMKTTFG